VTDNPTTVRYGKVPDWVILGGESGPRRRLFNIEWLADGVRQCDEAGVRVFVKQDSALRPGQRGRIPDEVWTRKEWPEVERLAGSLRRRSRSRSFGRPGSIDA
jgi:protein gp37